MTGTTIQTVSCETAQDLYTFLGDLIDDGRVRYLDLGDGDQTIIVSVERETLSDGSTVESVTFT